MDRVGSEAYPAAEQVITGFPWPLKFPSAGQPGRTTFTSNEGTHLRITVALSPFIHPRIEQSEIIRIAGLSQKLSRTSDKIPVQIGRLFFRPRDVSQPVIIIFECSFTKRMSRFLFAQRD